jgi:hypothetical protein
MAGTNERPPSDPYAGADDGLDALLQRARAGDPAAPPALKAYLDANPALWDQAGDLAAHSERAWITLIAGPDAVFAEALQRKAAALRAEVAGREPSPLEELLAARISACWLQVYYAEGVHAQQSKEMTPRLADYSQRRIESAARRFNQAVAALAAVRKLLEKAGAVKAGPAASPPTLALVSPDETKHDRRPVRRRRGRRSSL